MVTNQSDVLITTQTGSHNTVGIITLNRPKALNALSHQMIKDITAAMINWQKDDNIKAVFIRSNSEKAFCAGGDIRSLYLHGRQNPLLCMEFFKDEYHLNTLIKNYSKPYIALIHGITMGGGAGISIHGRHIVAANNVVFAMPETAIGFFPDIGGSYFLSRCKDFTGVYLALTGQKINACDAYYLDLVTNVINNNDYNQVFDTIITNTVDTSLNQHQDISQIISASITQASNSSTTLNVIQDNIDYIKKYFHYPSVAQIINNLEKYQDNCKWAKQTLHTLKQKSPTSLITTFELLKRCKELSFEQCMEQDYGLAYGFLLHNDLYEGIRAALIDKDNNPIWDKVDLNSSSFNYAEYFRQDIAEKLYI